MSDSVLAKVTFFENDTITYQVTAFLFEDTLNMPRFRWMALRHIFKAKVPMTRLSKHGDEVTYNDGKKRVRRFEYQRFQYAKYFDEDNKEITREEFEPGYHNVRDGPNEYSETWIYTGTGKRKK